MNSFAWHSKSSITNCKGFSRAPIVAQKILAVKLGLQAMCCKTEVPDPETLKS